MVLRVAIAPRQSFFDRVMSEVDALTSAADPNLAFVVAPPKGPSLSSPPGRGVFRPPLGGPGAPRPFVPNPIAGGLMLAVALWEMWNNTQKKNAPVASADSLAAPQPQVAQPSPAVPLPNDVTDVVFGEPDWAALAASGNRVQLMREVRAFLRRLQQELVARIDRGDYPPSIMQWYQDTVMPALKRILKSLDSERDSIELIDRIWPMIAVVPMFLQAQQMDTARELVVPTPRGLSAIIDEIVARYADRVSVTQLATFGARLAHTVDLEKFRDLLEEVIRNAAARPRKKGDVVHITIDLFVGSIVIRSDDKQDPYSEGWDRAWDKGNALGITVENEREGKDSVATLILPDGVVEPDPWQFVLGRQGDPIVLHIVIDAMTPEQRAKMLRDMKTLMDRIEDQAFSQGLDALASPTGERPHAMHLEGIAARMQYLMERLVEGIEDLKIHQDIQSDFEQMWRNVHNPRELEVIDKFATVVLRRQKVPLQKHLPRDRLK